MQTYVCLLRAVNVGGNNIIKMKDLAEILKAMGLESIQTYLQSGNVVFKSKEGNIPVLEDKIQELLRQKCNLSIRVFIYSKEDWLDLSNDNPYAERDIKFQYITFVEENITNDQLEAIKEKLLPNDVLLNRGKALYFYFPEGYGTTKINNQFLEKTMKMMTTTRNRNTVDKIKEMIMK